MLLSDKKKQSAIDEAADNEARIRLREIVAKVGKYKPNRTSVLTVQVCNPVEAISDNYGVYSTRRLVKQNLEDVATAIKNLHGVEQELYNLLTEIDDYERKKEEATRPKEVRDIVGQMRGPWPWSCLKKNPDGTVDILDW